LVFGRGLHHGNHKAFENAGVPGSLPNDFPSCQNSAGTADEATGSVQENVHAEARTIAPPVGGYLSGAPWTSFFGRISEAKFKNRDFLTAHVLFLKGVSS
jgi:hypothetical protein